MDSCAEARLMSLPIVELAPPARRPKGRGRLRAVVLATVHLMILAHVAHYFVRGRTLSAVEPSEAMYAIELGHLNAGTIFFGLAILSTAIFGRFFCGWACHLVALQDLCACLLRCAGIRLAPLRSRMLSAVPYALAFYMFFWPTLRRIWQGHAHPGLVNHLVTENLWATFPGPSVAILTLLVCGGLCVFLLGNKGFCTYVCPYGAFFAVADHVAYGRIRVTDACNQCGHCTAACTSNVRVHEEVRDHRMILDSNCMKCMDCVSVCPNQALFYGFAVAAPEGKPAAARRHHHYSFSWPEDIASLVVTGLAFLALRGLYGGTPLLLAAALGVITGLLSLLTARLLKGTDVRLQKLQLSRGGRVTLAGRVFLVLLLVWCACVAHSAVVQFCRYRGHHALSRVTITWPELLGHRNRSEQVTPSNLDLARRAHRSLGISDQLGFLGVGDVKIGLASAALVMNDEMSAEHYLRQAILLEPEPHGAREMLMELLAFQGRLDAAAELIPSDIESGK